MKIIKGYTAIQLGQKTVDDNVVVSMRYGRTSGPYYSQGYPETYFGTEEEAIEYAYKHDRYAKWVILPTIQFDYIADSESEG